MLCREPYINYIKDKGVRCFTNSQINLKLRLGVIRKSLPNQDFVICKSGKDEDEIHFITY